MWDFTNVKFEIAYVIDNCILLLMLPYVVLMMPLTQSFIIQK